MSTNRHCATNPLVLALFLAAGAGMPQAALAQYGPPAGYYNSLSATSIDQQLTNELHIIASIGFDSQSYSYAGSNLDSIDVDITNTSNMILIYDGDSISRQNCCSNWNREHVWPRSLGVDSSGPDYSDLHMLRPSDAGTNSSRGNSAFGTSNSEWFPTLGSIEFRGEIARAAMYADVRYDGNESSTTDLTLSTANSSSNNQMGDVRELLYWNYEFPPSPRELFRHHQVATNHQMNRNPFVDRPDLAWAIWGVRFIGANNSQIRFGASTNADGSSSQTFDLGRRIVGNGNFGAMISATKFNDHPTSYVFSASGDITTTGQGEINLLARGAQSIDIPVQIVDDGSTGLRTGTITIDNFERSSGGAGQGSQDADDVATVQAAFLAHSNVSWDDQADTNIRTVDLGSFALGTGLQSVNVPIYNVGGATSDDAADAVITGLTYIGDDAVLTTDLAVTDAIPVGAPTQIAVSIDTASLGDFGTIVIISNTDEAVLGAQAGTPVRLNLEASVVGSLCPADTDGNGVINGLDFNAVLNAFGTSAGQFGFSPAADTDGNGVVNGLDFNAILNAFGTACN